MSSLKKKRNKRKNFVYIISINIVVLVAILMTINLVSSLGISLAMSIYPGKETFYPFHWPELPFRHRDRDYIKQLETETNEINFKFIQFYPFIGFTWPKHEGKYVNTNQQGERIVVPTSSQEKNKGVIRFFGGSTMWGMGAEDKETIPSLIKQNFPDYLVFNHGQLAYTSRQSLAKLINLANQSYSLDYVVFLDGVNDPMISCYDVFKSNEKLVNIYGFSQQFGQILEQYQQYNQDIFGAFKQTLYGSTLKFLNLLKRRNQNLWDSSRDLSPLCLQDPNYADKVANAMIQNWKIAHDIVTSRGGNFIVLLQPMRFVGNYRFNQSSPGESYYETFKLMYFLFQKKLEQENLFWVYDLTHIFDSVESHVYLDYAHLSGEGNKIVVKRISEILTPILSSD
ncbi:hypothetical protein [Spirulina sp. 06S082]|uniref:hypothetical protein n=1 Tax=Spirulina sp. 06S082 TaxID=3110248 RepID=UPI002B1EE440|nr:hypothetical protein [Spirulina sp. 06S082]MEA5468839.1 hypothetical protein [Spirulina sp. 06S082]